MNATEQALEAIARAADAVARKVENLPISEAAQAKEAAEAVSLLADALWDPRDEC